MKINVDIPEILKFHRENSGHTQTEIAELLNIPKSTYGSYEEGRAEPGIKTLIHLSLIYGFSTLDEFLKLQISKDAGTVSNSYYRLSKTHRQIVDYIFSIS